MNTYEEFKERMEYSGSLERIEYLESLDINDLRIEEEKLRERQKKLAALYDDKERDRIINEQDLEASIPFVINRLDIVCVLFDRMDLNRAINKKLEENNGELELYFDHETRVTCPRCDAVSGDAWWQCGGRCPMYGSPYYDPTWKPSDGKIDHSLDTDSLDTDGEDDIPY